jgi:hypothetical protein
LLEELGAKVRWVSLEQLCEGIGLEKAAMVLLAHTEQPLPELPKRDWLILPETAAPLSLS